MLKPKKILIIPSWYPTLKQPLKGSFFREQAEFLNQSKVGQMLVLYGEEQSTPFLKLIWIFFLSFVKRTWPIQKELLIQEPNAFGFIIPTNRRLPERLRVKFAVRLYQKAFLSLKAIGFTPDLIHAQSGMDAGIYAHDLSKIHNIPFVIIEHQVFVFHYYSRFKGRLVLNAFEAAKKTAAVSFDERRQVLINQPHCNPTVIPNLVDESKFALKSKINGEKFEIVTFMYAIPVKGYSTFFHSMYELQKMSDSFNFTVVGNGVVDGINIFEKLCEELKLAEKSNLIPRIEREGISDFLQKFDLYVCSSDFETFGIAPREAMMCGLPVISTANGGVEDSIYKETGLVVPVKDPIELAKAILETKVNLSIYDPKKIRGIAIQQCGSKAFLRQMTEFYN